MEIIVITVAIVLTLLLLILWRRRRAKETRTILIGNIIAMNWLIESNPKYAINYLDRGELYWELKDKVKNESYIPLSLFNDPTITFSSSYAKDALKDVDEAIRLDSEFIDAYIFRSEIHKHFGNITEEIEDLTTAIQLNPKSQELYAELHYVRGCAWASREQDIPGTKEGRSYLAKAQKDLDMAIHKSYLVETGKFNSHYARYSKIKGMITKKLYYQA